MEKSAPKNSRKKPEHKTTALQVIPKVKLGRSCRACSSLNVKQINSAIGNGKSFRDIAGQFGLSKSSVARHTENCLKLDIHALLKERRLDQAVDHYKELHKQLEFAHEMQDAARELLTDTNTGKITLAPRDYEVEVLYLDYADTDPLTGLPKRKKEKLSEILLAVQQIRSGFSFTGVGIKTINYFDAAIKTIDAIDKVLDKFAKVDGHYQKERESDEKLSKVAMAFKKFMEVEPEHQKDAENWLQIFAKQSGVDLKRLADRVGVELE